MMKMRAQMIKTTNYFNENDLLGQISAGEQNRLDVNSPFSIYFGLNDRGCMRLSFLSLLKPPKLESTSNIEIHQGPDKTKIYWTNFDLVISEQQNVFLSFCDNLIQSIAYTLTEEQAFAALRRQYAKWRSLFKASKENDVSRELIQGTYGELFFLKNFMIPKYGIERSVRSWSGADITSKDFSIDTTWYEVKSIGTKSATVKISSLTQLSSEYNGYLVIHKVEKMSEEYDDKDCCIKNLFNEIRSLIKDDNLESLFFEKLSGLGIALSDKAMKMKFSVKLSSYYLVDDFFPRLTEKNIPFSEVVDAEYSLNVESLKKYETQIYD